MFDESFIDNKDAFLEADKVALSTITVQLRAFKFSINFWSKVLV